MKLVIQNTSSDALSYVGGLVSVPANSSQEVASGYWVRLYSDLQFLTDLRNSNLILSDGVSSYRYPNSENYITTIIENLKFDAVRKDFSYSTAQTNTVIWTPASGKKYVVTDLTMNIRNNTLGAITVTIFDDTNASGNILYKANFEAGSNFDTASNFITSFVSSGINKSLKITTSGALMISGTFQGYETE